MCINGHTVQTCFPRSVLQLSSLEVPPAWQKVDVLREARVSRGLLSDGPVQRRVMEEVFFLKRLQTIRDFFRLCTSFAQTLSGKSGTTETPITPVMLVWIRLPLSTPI